MVNFGKALRDLTGIRDRVKAQMDKDYAKGEYGKLGDTASVLKAVEAAIEQVNAVDASAAAPAPTRAPRRKKAAPAAKQPAKAPKAAKVPAAAPAAPAAAPAPAKRQIGGKQGYPKFARAGKKLVEIKWNAKKNGEQRHRMDYGTVSLFTKAINKNGGKVFRKNLLTDVTTKEGNKLPLHQVYSVLGWLLSNEAIVKKGRGDYHPNPEKMALAALKETFNALPNEGTQRVSSKKK